jgi:putative flippase GtrA
MRKTFTKIGIRIQGWIDLTHPPFRKIITLQLYRYGICGTTNVLLDWILYFLSYNFIIQHRDVNLAIITLSPHIATLTLIFPIITSFGFLSQKYVTFTTSALRGRTQLIRYLIVVFINLLINYAGLKLLVDGLHFYPTPSKMIITLVTITCSYIGQKKFTFSSPPHCNPKP